MSINVGSNAFIATLAQSLAAGGAETTIYLSTITNLTGEVISTADFATFGKGTITIDPLSSANIEFASFTGVDSVNLALTGGTRNLSGKGYSSLSSTSKFHPAGTQVIIAFGTHNLSDLITYVTALMAGTIGNASSTVAGITKLSLNPVTPTIPIAVGDNDTRVPTATQTSYLSTVSQIGLFYAADSVGTDAYAITLSPAPAAYVAGMTINFKAGTANTGAATLKINALAAITIKKNVSADLATGDILVNQIVTVVYDGTNFQLISNSSQNLQVTNSGIVDRDISLGTVLNIPHGLPSTPKYFRLTTNWSNSPNGASSITTNTALAVYTTTGGINYACSSFATGDGATGSVGRVVTSAYALYSSVSTGGDIANLAAVTVDSTNIILTWTKTGSPAGTIRIVWEALV